MRVLHVSDCYAGGVSRAIESIVGIVPEYEHLLAYDGGESPSLTTGFSSVERLSGSKFAKTLQLLAIARRCRPDIIHAHSSWAGVFSRVVRMPAPVVYQPHCFVFDDPYRWRISRFAFKVAERVLSLSSKVILTLTEHEVQLALAAGLSGSLIRLPNIPTVGESLYSPVCGVNTSPLAVAMVGRLARQKDPVFFAKVAGAFRSDERFRFVWIGDGESQYRRVLEDAGVRVTGWLGSERLVDELTSASVYLHSAAYEGYPLSVLDAAALGCAVIVRKIPAFDDDQFASVERPEQAVELLKSVAENYEHLDGMRCANLELLSRMNRDAQRKVIVQTYRSLVA